MPDIIAGGRPRTNVARFYDWLSRFQDVTRRIGHDTGRAELTVHRRLRDASGPPSGVVVHERLVDALRASDGLPASPTVLDAGCGLGGTTFFLQASLGGTYVGVTLSEGQRARATREAERRGLAQVCRFVVRSYDEPLDDLLPAGADLVVAIESLAHAVEPARTIRRLATCLRPGGCLAIVDDMPDPGLAPDDPDFSAFRRGWLCSAIASAAALEAACRDAGLAVARRVDLTSLVPLRDEDALARLVRLNGAARLLARLTPARTLVESLHGGLMLERLYRRRAMTYALVIARAPGVVSGPASARSGDGATE